MTITKALNFNRFQRLRYWVVKYWSSMCLFICSECA